MSDHQPSGLHLQPWKEPKSTHTQTHPLEKLNVFAPFPLKGEKFVVNKFVLCCELTVHHKTELEGATFTHSAPQSIN